MEKKKKSCLRSRSSSSSTQDFITAQREPRQREICFAACDEKGEKCLVMSSCRPVLEF